MNKAGNKAGNRAGNIARCVPEWVEEIREITKQVNADIEKLLAPLGEREKKVNKRGRQKKIKSED